MLIPVFGGLPVASLPANLLAVPAAGAVMVWASAGLVAGAAGALARVLHVVTSALVGWVAGVARVAAAFPLGEIGDGLVVLLGAGIAGYVARSREKSDGSVWRP